MLQDSKARSPVWKFNPEKEQPELQRAWNQFIRTGKIKTPVVPSHIAESRVRSWDDSINLYYILPTSHLSKDQYEQRVQNTKHLIQLARAILKNVLKSFGSARYIVALRDQARELLDPPRAGGPFLVWGILFQL